MLNDSVSSTKGTKTEKHVVFAEQLGYDNHRQRKPTFENITAY